MARMDHWTESQVEQMLFMGNRDLLREIPLIDLIFIYESYPRVRERFNRANLWDWLFQEKVMYVVKEMEGYTTQRVGPDARKNCMAWYFAFEQYLYSQTGNYKGITGHFVNDQNDHVQVDVDYRSIDFQMRILPTSPAASDVHDYVLGKCRALRRAGTGLVVTGTPLGTTWTYLNWFGLCFEVAQTYYTLMDRGWFMRIYRNYGRDDALEPWLVRQPIHE